MIVLQAMTGIMVINRDHELDPAMSCVLFALIAYDMFLL